MVVLLGLLFMSNNTYAQDNSNLGQKLKQQLHKFLELTGDPYFGDGEAFRVQEKKQLKDGSGDGNGDGTGDCIGFVDDDGDGVCDNCGGTDLAERKRSRDRDSEGLGIKKRIGGN